MTVLPITTPSRIELWRRVQLAKAVPRFRESTPDTVAVVLQILDGVSLDELVRQEVLRGNE